MRWDVSKKEGVEAARQTTEYRRFVLLKKFSDAYQCATGAQLHSLVNPPVKEQLTRSSIYPGNLSATLEQEKLHVLKAMVTAAAFGQSLTIYIVVRYGFGQHTAITLDQSEFEFEQLCSRVDAQEDGGPDYHRFDAQSFWFGEENQNILEIPATGGYIGCAHGIALPVYELVMMFKRFRLPDIFYRGWEPLTA